VSVATLASNALAKTTTLANSTLRKRTTLPKTSSVLGAIMEQLEEENASALKTLHGARILGSGTSLVLK
jgi:hypothetical protein